MYFLQRVSKTPASALTIQIDQPAGEGDGGFQGGGVWLFQPAGQDGDRHQVSEHAAQAVMSDPSLAHHFTVSPDLPNQVAGPAADEQPDSASGATAKAGRGGRGK